MIEERTIRILKKKAHAINPISKTLYTQRLNQLKNFRKRKTKIENEPMRFINSSRGWCDRRQSESPVKSVHVFGVHKRGLNGVIAWENFTALWTSSARNNSWGLLSAETSCLSSILQIGSKRRSTDLSLDRNIKVKRTQSMIGIGIASHVWHESMRRSDTELDGSENCKFYMSSDVVRCD